MSHRIVKVETEQQRAELYRFRYRVYVEELQMTQVADHERRWLYDDLDEVGVSFMLVDDDKVMGSLRLVYLQDVAPDNPLYTQLVDKFGLAPALEHFGVNAICTTSRFILDQQLRHGKAIFRLMQAGYRDAHERGMRLNYGDCSPQMLPLYEHLGYRRYTDGYNDTQYGYKVPILMLAGDCQQFARVRSPLLRLARQHDDDQDAHQWFAQEYAQYIDVESAAFFPPEIFFDILAERVSNDPLHSVALLQGLNREEAERFLSAATLLTLRSGDRVIRQGEVDNTLYVLLSGIAEIQLDDNQGPPLAVIGAGDSFGEIGFLTEVPRTANVVARADCQVLMLSHDFMQRFIEHEPAAGAKLMLNLSRELAGRLGVANHRAAIIN